MACDWLILVISLLNCLSRVIERFVSVPYLIYNTEDARGFENQQHITKFL